ncbi:glycerate kinase [Rappaport israeli]|uniref:glycerate kinase n=1 Tax=Rappaport israeli TaxID=1839807 RepID=UPI000930AC0D|nr:glycerate kinase [Rappaport israeli]
MNILIAPDSFKESLSALEVAQAIATGFKKVFPDAQYQLLPMADGGEGTVQSIIDATQGKRIYNTVTDPLGNPTQAFWGITGDGKSAIIEIAQASGLHLVPNAQRNPLITTSYGTGELIKAALDEGVQHIILGIGGSATNDAGVGLLQALGAQFFDEQNQKLDYGGAALTKLSRINLGKLHPRLQQVHIDVACDVNNPLCGAQGASAIFAPQKGATEAQVKQLDRALLHFAQKVQQQFNIDIQTPKGAGAAGGMGSGLLLLPHATLKSGVTIVAEALNLAKKISQADLIITGEGRMDAQSIQGKTPIGVAQIAKTAGKPVIAIVGSLRADYSAVYKHGIDAVFPIITQIDTPENTLQQAHNNLKSSAENIARLWQLKS